MKLWHGNDHIVRFKSGKVWHFFSRKGCGIYFRRFDKNRGWQNEMQLVPHALDYFSLSIDRNDMLHLVYQDQGGQVKYMKYNGRDWDEQLVALYDPATYIVHFVSVVPFNDGVHIFFSSGPNPSTGMWNIHHCYFNGSKWVDDKIISYTAQKQPGPLYFDLHGKNLHMIYRSLFNGKYQLFHCYFDDNLKRWSKPERITRSQTDCTTPSLLLNGNRLHLVWTSIENANLQVKYISWNYNQHFKFGTEPETLLSGNESNCLYPQLLWAENRLWCIWYQNSDLYCCSSSDDGATWSEPKPMEWSHFKRCYCIRYCSNYPNDLTAFKLHRIYANLDTGLELPIIGKYISLPMPALAGHKKNHESEQKATALSYQKDENEKKSSEVLPETKEDTASQPETETVHETAHTAELQTRDNTQKDFHNDSQTTAQDNAAGRDKDSTAIVNSIRALLNEMDQNDDLQTKFLTLFSKTNPPDNSIDLVYKLDRFLDLWIKNAEAVQAESQTIMRETEVLRRRSIENKRQWEILIEEFEEIKDLLYKHYRKGFLDRFISRKLAN